MRDISAAIRAEEVETVWMSEAAGVEYRLSPSERVAMNRYLVNGWLALHAPDNRSEN